MIAIWRGPPARTRCFQRISPRPVRSDYVHIAITPFGEPARVALRVRDLLQRPNGCDDTQELDQASHCAPQGRGRLAEASILHRHPQILSTLYLTFAAAPKIVIAAQASCQSRKVLLYM